MKNILTIATACAMLVGFSSCNDFLTEESKSSLTAPDYYQTQAQAEANEIITDAKLKSRDMRKAVNDYVDEMLRQADEMLTSQVNEIKKTRQNIKASQRPAAQVKVQKPETNE